MTVKGFEIGTLFARQWVGHVASQEGLATIGSDTVFENTEEPAIHAIVESNIVRARLVVTVDETGNAVSMDLDDEFAIEDVPKVFFVELGVIGLVAFNGLGPISNRITNARRARNRSGGW